MAKKLLLLVTLLAFGLAACQADPAPAATATVAVAAAPIATATPTPLPPATATALPPTAMPSPTPEPAAPSMAYLSAALDEALADFDGLSSIYVVDLQTGETLARDADLAIAGMSLVKIPILVEAYRAIDDTPNVEQTKLISETMGILSGNATANWLLEDIAGQPDVFAGADIMTESMKRLGLYNTFIAVPYDMDPREGRLPTYLTPANQRTDVTTFPDPYRQTTVGDLGRLLTMIYECAEHDRGHLREVYPDTITQSECAEMIAVMKRLDLNAFIEAGVPEDTPVAHKHGWIDDTHGDAGIVFSPGGDYVLAAALYSEGWLEWETGAPVMAEISRRVYEHFNNPDVYAGVELPPPTPTVAASPTPDLPRAIVANTAGVGLTVRDRPGGAELVVLADGTNVALLPDAPVNQGGYEWLRVRAPNGQEGWAAADFLQPWTVEE